MLGGAFTVSRMEGFAGAAAAVCRALVLALLGGGLAVRALEREERVGGMLQSYAAKVLSEEDRMMRRQRCGKARAGQSSFRRKAPSSALASSAREFCMDRTGEMHAGDRWPNLRLTLHLPGRSCVAHFGD